ncbi:MAG TPA: Hpt domain-containing protein, partial [Solirubrobacteraceae bacterium]|nr:Hpt domain-containing protein [Solirubrobacteraceae bacterium]
MSGLQAPVRLSDGPPGPSDARPSDVPARPSEDWMGELLDAVWARQRGLIEERIDSIDRALTTLCSARLDERSRAQAEHAAHMLAGSLGTFGFWDASEAALQIEFGLVAGPAPRDAPGLSRLLGRLREEVEDALVPPSGCT